MPPISLSRLNTGFTYLGVFKKCEKHFSRVLKNSRVLIFLVFMSRHHFPKQKNINPCEVLVLSYVRPSKIVLGVFVSFEPERCPHYVIDPSLGVA